MQARPRAITLNERRERNIYAVLMRRDAVSNSNPTGISGFASLAKRLSRRATATTASTIRRGVPFDSNPIRAFAEVCSAELTN